jgi:hypothetical protein
MIKNFATCGLRKASLPIFAAAALALLSPIFLTSHTRASAQDNSKPRQEIGSPSWRSYGYLEHQ